MGLGEDYVKILYHFVSMNNLNWEGKGEIEDRKRSTE